MTVGYAAAFPAAWLHQYLYSWRPWSMAVASSSHRLDCIRRSGVAALFVETAVGNTGAVAVVASVAVLGIDVAVDYRRVSHVTAAESVREGFGSGLRLEIQEGVVHEGQGRIAAGSGKGGGGIAARWGSFWLRQRTFAALGCL